MAERRDWFALAAVTDELSQAAAAVTAAESALAAAQAERRRAVVAALDLGMSPTSVASMAGVTRRAVYQMRDAARDSE